MANHLKMDQPDKRRRLDAMQQGLVGEAIDRPDGPLKVTGRAIYAHEWNIPGVVYGVLVRASTPKGSLLDIDCDPVLRMSGVLGVYSEQRFLRNPAQGTANDAPVQGVDKIDYMGQAIALVVAETFEQARHAAQTLKIRYLESNDGKFDPEARDADIWVPEDTKFEQGDFEAAMATSAFSVDQIFRTPCHSSAAMEPHCSIANWAGDQLTLHGSYQMLKYNRNELADSLGIAPENVRILSPYVGGAFGSKLGVSQESVAAAIAAKDLGRPVCVALSRQQVLETVMRRSESRQRIRLAANADGELTALGHECRVSNLPGEDFYEPVLQATHFVYACANRKLGMEVARVNRMCSGSVRAPGEAVGLTAVEMAMDELACAANLDPVELRIRNIPEQHPEQGIPYSSRRYREALEKGARRFRWDQREPIPGQRREGDWLIGLGMAGAARVNILSESKARVTLKADSTAIVETDMTDIGTGTYAILGQITGEMLGLPMKNVEAKLGDTRLPSGAGSGGSWGAASSGSSVFLACEEIRRQLAESMGCNEDELQLQDGQVSVNGKHHCSLQALLNGKSLSGEGSIEPGEAAEKRTQASYGAYFAEAAVNRVSGEIRVRRMSGTFSAGRILNAKTATSQCYGGMVWGIGMALTEELVFDDRDGHVVNRDLAEYHIPVNLDVPQIDVELLEERDDWANPLQAKGIGELALCGAAAAIMNAIYNASGLRVRELPAKLDKLLEELPSM